MATYATAQIKAVNSIVFNQGGAAGTFDVYECPANRFAVIHLHQIQISGTTPSGHRLSINGANYDGVIDWHIGNQAQGIKEIVLNAGEKIVSSQVGGGSSNRLIYGTVTEYQKPA